MANLVQTVIDAMSPDVTSKLAGAMGETPAGVTKGFSAATPALLAGAVQRSATPGGADSLLDLVRRAMGGGNPLDRTGAVAADPDTRSAYMAEGQGFASSLLGGQLGSVTSAVGSAAGIGSTSASGLLALAAPLVLGALGRAAGPAPTASGLQSLLSGQRPSILAALPTGLGSLFGLGAEAPSAGQYATAAVARAGTAPSAGGIGRFLPWIIGAIVLLGLLFALRTCTAERREVTPPPAAPALPEVRLPPMVSLKLPGGGTVNVPEGSIGYGVAKFLESNEPAPKTFIFDNLNYDTASNALTAESQPTIATLSSILKAYPNAAVRVVGYTDNQGDPAANKALSDARSATVKRELVAGGIVADRIETAGMGEQNPVADNTTDEGRAKNRRTELVIVRK